jgi:alpha-ribazole phosphatase/probable phosphoglycerate mutase
MHEGLVTTVDLLRHGEPEGGVKYRGSLDDPLSLRGWAQLRTAVGENCPWTAIVSSPLSRCAAFAGELANRHGLTLEIEPGFREISFGEWEGCTPADIMAATPNALRQFWSDPLTYGPPGGERIGDFNTRVATAWENLLQRHIGRHILLICHGGTIRILLRHILEMPLKRIWRLEVPYATLSRVCIYAHGPEAEPLLVFHGRSSL